MWFTELGTGKVGVISGKGVIKEYDTSSTGLGPVTDRRGPERRHVVQRVLLQRDRRRDPGGNIHEFPAGGGPAGIAASKTTPAATAYTGNQVGVVKLKK